MEENYVSLITPCYNGETFVARYLDSVLQQTYKNIEIIIINDGSIDDTAEIILSYEEKFKKAGMKFQYIFQENAGQAVAINKGLQVFTGKYLSWPDSDDILEKDYVKNKVMYLEKNPSVDMVLSKVAYVYEDELETRFWVTGREKPSGKDTFFDDLIFETNICFQPGAYMVKSDALLKYVGKEIYPSRAGQNWQLLLPMAYYGTIGYLDETLYCYVCRKNSHSREIYTEFDKELQRTYEHEDILKHEIKKIIANDQKKCKAYLISIVEKYARKRIEIGIKYNKKDIIEKEFQILFSIYKVKKEDKEIYHASKNAISFHILKMKRLGRKMKRLGRKVIRHIRE